MNTSSRIICVLSLLLTGFTHTAGGTDFIESWRMLEEDLVVEIKHAQRGSETFNPFVWKDMKELRVAQTIERCGLAVWCELLRRSEITMSQHVAFQCIAQHAQEFKTDAVFSLFIINDQPSSIVRISDAGEYLRTLAPTQPNFRTFSSAMSREVTKVGRGNVAFMISELPPTFLEAWVLRDHHVIIPASNEAIIVNHLLRPRTMTSGDVRKVISAKLLEYAKVPGFPRVVFLWNSSVGNELVLQALKSLVTDDSISDTECESAFMAHKVYIRSRLSDLLDAPGEIGLRRSARVRELMLKWPN